MATGGNKAKYAGEDRVDEWLLNQVVKHVDHDKIGFFARDLEVPESVYSGIPGDKDKTFKVSDLRVEESLYFQHNYTYNLTQ